MDQPADCPFCAGSGRYEKCGGSGERTVRPGWLKRKRKVRCSACHGSGKCQLCKGRGKVDA